MYPMLTHANFAVSWALLVLIWLVQLIIYPCFYRISPEAFISYHQWYVKRITFIVLPLMIAELALAARWILLDHYSAVSVLYSFFIFIIWLSTFALQVPIHNRLKSGKDDMLIRRLLLTNWIRTAAWSLKAFVATIHLVNSSTGSVISASRRSLISILFFSSIS